MQRVSKKHVFMFFLGAFLSCFGSHAKEQLDRNGVRLWQDALHRAGDTLRQTAPERRAQTAVMLWNQLEDEYPRCMDWVLQDAFDPPLWTEAPAGGREQFRTQSELIGPRLAEWLMTLDETAWRSLLRRMLQGLESERIVPPDAVGGQLARIDRLSLTKLAECYLEVCRFRREARLAPLFAQGWDGIVFARHFNMGGSHYAYTEGLSDAQKERHFYPGTALQALRFDGTKVNPETLLEDPNGVIRDADISWDGTRILFAWKRSDREDDYSLYEMDVRTREIRPITGAPGHADYEPAYLPNGDIVFNSTRCVQTVDCWWTEVSNLYTCAADGSYLRRLTFDQVHTNYPAVTGDGRVMYTRWDYNDRGQLYPQGLFEMYPDGTAQREHYANNAWFPTTILHARNIPDTGAVLAIFSGHHTWQAGKLGVIDPARGRQEAEGAQLVAPVRYTPAERIDQYGQEGALYKYPYPVNERFFLVSAAPRGWEESGALFQAQRPVFGLYFMNMEGHRELLYLDSANRQSVGRMVPLAPRAVPPVRPSTVDYQKDSGTYYVQDIYASPGLVGVEKGAVAGLRVVALAYRPAGIGSNRNSGAAGAALVSTPIAIDDGSWDVKIPLGEARVYGDGSAMFAVPARTPVYFQALDDRGRAIQSMRSWSVLQPGETHSCIGCHDNKNTAPMLYAASTEALQAGAQVLDPVYGPPRGFSFPERIQPILDKHCVRCHNGGKQHRVQPASIKTAFSLLDRPRVDSEAKRIWTDSYLRLTKGGPDAGAVRWISPQSVPTPQLPYTAGSVTSPLMDLLEAGHHDVRLTPEELRRIACWIDLAVPFCGDYAEANAWDDAEKQKYEYFLKKRMEMEAIECANIQSYIAHRP